MATLPSSANSLNYELSVCAWRGARGFGEIGNNALWAISFCREAKEDWLYGTQAANRKLIILESSKGNARPRDF